MHILHITGSYGGTEVYRNLITCLDRLGLRQTVFVPLNYSNRNRSGNHPIDFKVKESKIIYSKVLKRIDKYLYRHKINGIKNDIEKRIDLSDVDCIHCANICTDGAVAYEIWKKYGIPFITAVRNTDIYTYYKIFIWQRKYFNKVFHAAKRVVFIGPSHRDVFSRISNIPVDASKTITIPNGVNDYYLNNRYNDNHPLHRPVRVIFASGYSSGKSLLEVILAVKYLRDELSIDIVLDAVGDGLPFRKVNGRYLAKLYKLRDENDWLTLSRYLPKEELIDKYRESDLFVMPSKPETFGLVYVEALTQGLPIIYGKGQGFDGFFEEGSVGYHAQAFDVKDIADVIIKVLENYDILKHNIAAIPLEEQFSWETIAKQYMDIYRNII